MQLGIIRSSSISHDVRLQEPMWCVPYIKKFEKKQNKTEIARLVPSLFHARSMGKLLFRRSK
jgi:hypothetical protein